MTRVRYVEGFAILSLLWMMSVASAAQWSIPKGFKVVNNNALNNRVKNGDIIRYVWIEDNYEFALVFLNTGPPSSFVPPNSKFYLSVITKPGGDPSLWNTVWSANRNMPVKENATLALDSSGNLVLTDSDGTFVWSTQLHGATIAAAELDLSGNLQFLNSANKTVWQSVDYPADSLLPGQYLKSGKSLVGAISAVSYSGTNYGVGKYSMEAYPGGLILANSSGSGYYVQSAETNANTLVNVYHTCLHPNDEFFDSSSGLVIKPDLTKTSPKADPTICGKGDQNVTVVISVPQPASGVFTSQFVRIDPDGVLRLYQYSVDSRAYKAVGSVGDPLHPVPHN